MTFRFSCFTRLSPVLLLVACGATPTGPEASEPTPTGTKVDAFDIPITGLARSWIADFNDGDLLFSTPLREADGLGPLYTRAACSSCHETGVRGPGLVQKMSVVDDDGVTP
ncbi:MAG TPA: hypothetical protein VNN72_24730, partial [Polyangiaceae bacterium]|nr:hypothetical protein [Polyangiaceae bacterium]